MVIFHRAEEATSALRWNNFGQLARYLAIERHCLQRWEWDVAKAVMPAHQLGLIVSGGKLDVFFLSPGGVRVKGESPLTSSVL